MNWYKKAQLNKISINAIQFVRELRNFNVVKDPKNYKKLINLNNNMTTTIHDWHRGKDMNKGLMIKMLKDLGLNPKDFNNKNYDQKITQETPPPQEDTIPDWQKQDWYIQQQQQQNINTSNNWYKKAQLSSEIIQKYESLISEFINESESPMYKKVLTDQSWAVGACGTVSRDLVEFFTGKGINAEVLGCTGFISDLPEDAHEQWQKFKGEDRKYLWHAVVKTEDAIIDLTGGQYGEVFSGVQIKPIEEYLKNWQENAPHRGY
jgi:hypothetical protein